MLISEVVFSFIKWEWDKGWEAKWSSCPCPQKHSEQNHLLGGFCGDTFFTHDLSPQVLILYPLKLWESFLCLWQRFSIMHEHQNQLIFKHNQSETHWFKVKPHFYNNLWFFEIMLSKLMEPGPGWREHSIQLSVKENKNKMVFQFHFSFWEPFSLKFWSIIKLKSIIYLRIWMCKIFFVYRVAIQTIPRRKILIVRGD